MLQVHPVSQSGRPRPVPAGGSRPAAGGRANAVLTGLLPLLVALTLSGCGESQRPSAVDNPQDRKLDRHMPELDARAREEDLKHLAKDLKTEAERRTLEWPNQPLNQPDPEAQAAGHGPEALVDLQEQSSSQVHTWTPPPKEFHAGQR